MFCIRIEYILEIPKNYAQLYSKSIEPLLGVAHWHPGLGTTIRPEYFSVVVSEDMIAVGYANYRVATKNSLAITKS